MMKVADSLLIGWSVGVLIYVLLRKICEPMWYMFQIRFTHFARIVYPNSKYKESQKTAPMLLINCRNVSLSFKIANLSYSQLTSLIHHLVPVTINI